MPRKTRSELDKQFPVAKKSGNPQVEARALKAQKLRHMKRVGFTSTDKGGGSGRLGTRSQSTRHHNSERYMSLQPEDGSNLAKAF